MLLVVSSITYIPFLPSSLLIPSCFFTHLWFDSLGQDILNCVHYRGILNLMGLSVGSSSLSCSSG